MEVEWWGGRDSAYNYQLGSYGFYLCSLYTVVLVSLLLAYYFFILFFIIWRIVLQFQKQWEKVARYDFNKHLAHQDKKYKLN